MPDVFDTLQAAPAAAGDVFDTLDATPEAVTTAPEAPAGDIFDAVEASPEPTTPPALSPEAAKILAVQTDPVDAANAVAELSNLDQLSPAGRRSVLARWGYEEPGVVGSFGNALAKGYMGVGESILSAPSGVINPWLATDPRAANRRMANAEVNAPSSGLSDTAGRAIGSAAPFVVGSLLGGPIVSTALGALSGMGQVRQDIAQYEDDTGTVVPTGKAALAVGLGGAVEGVTEGLSAGASGMVGRWLGGGVARRGLGSMVGGALLGNLVTNPAEEAAAESAYNAIAQNLYDPDRKLSEGVVDAAIGGAFAGGAMTPVSVNAAVQQQRWNRAVEQRGQQITGQPVALAERPKGNAGYLADRIARRSAGGHVWADLGEGPGGFVDPETGLTYLNSRSPEKSLAAVSAHEVLHTLETKHKEAYAKFAAENPDVIGLAADLYAQEAMESAANYEAAGNAELAAKARRAAERAKSDSAWRNREGMSRLLEKMVAGDEQVAKMILDRGGMGGVVKDAAAAVLEQIGVGSPAVKRMAQKQLRFFDVMSQYTARNAASLSDELDAAVAAKAAPADAVAPEEQAAARPTLEDVNRRASVGLAPTSPATPDPIQPRTPEPLVPDATPAEQEAELARMQRVRQAADESLRNVQTPDRPAEFVNDLVDRAAEDVRQNPPSMRDSLSPRETLDPALRRGENITVVEQQAAREADAELAAREQMAEQAAQDRPRTFEPSEAPPAPETPPVADAANPEQPALTFDPEASTKEHLRKQILRWAEKYGHLPGETAAAELEEAAGGDPEFRFRDRLPEEVRIRLARPDGKRFKRFFRVAQPGEAVYGEDAVTRMGGYDKVFRVLEEQYVGGKAGRMQRAIDAARKADDPRARLASAALDAERVAIVDPGDIGPGDRFTIGGQRYQVNAKGILKGPEIPDGVALSDLPSVPMDAGSLKQRKRPARAPGQAPSRNRGEAAMLPEKPADNIPFSFTGNGWGNLRNQDDLFSKKRNTANAAGEQGHLFGMMPDHAQAQRQNLEGLGQGGLGQPAGERDSTTGRPTDLGDRRVHQHTSRDLSARLRQLWQRWQSGAGGSGKTGQEEHVTRLNALAETSPVSPSEFGFSSQKHLYTQPHASAKMTYLGRGSESFVFKAADGKHVFKFIPNTPEQGGIGLTLTLDVRPDGEIVPIMHRGTYGDVVRRLAVISSLGGAPTEIVGVMPGEYGSVVLKQPYAFGDVNSSEVSAARATARMEEIPADVMRRSGRIWEPPQAVVVDGKPYIVVDVRDANLMRDSALRPRMIDGVVVAVGDEVLAKSPKLKAIFDRLQAVEANQPDRSDVPFSFTGSKPTPGQTYTLPEEGAVDLIRRKLQDEFLPLRRTQEALVGQGGRVDDSNDAYLRQTLFQGRVGDRHRQIESTFVKPIVAKMSEAGLTVEDVDEFLIARHAQERNATIAARGGVPDGSGMSDADARAVLARWAGNAAMADIADRVQKLNRQTLENAVADGIVSRQQANDWEAQWKHYVPLRTADEEGRDVRPGQGFNIKGKEFRAATGRTSGADSPLVFSLVQAQEKAVRGEKNRVGQSLLKLVQDNPDADLWTVDRRPTQNALKNGQVSTAPDPRFRLADNVVSVKVDGQEHLIEFKGEAGKRLAGAMKKLGSADAGWIVKSIGRVTSALRLSATALNPEFLMPNMVRDVQAAAINLSSEQSGKIATAMLKDVLPAARAVWQVSGNRNANRGSRLHDYMREYTAAGGQVDGYSVQDFARSQKQLASLLKDASPTTGRRALIAVRKAGEFVNRANGSLETATRLAAYAAARDAGMSVDRAAELAKNLTVNFNRKGEWGYAINALYMFSNAGIQGNARLVQSLAKSRRGRQIAGAMLMSGVALGILSPMMFGKDDQDRDVWDTIPDSVKQKNLLIPTGGGKYAKIPLPYGYNVLYNTGRLIGETLRNPKRAGRNALYAVDGVLNAFNPLGDSGSLLQMVTPTIGDPIVQQYENKDWTGRPIVPEQSPFGTPKPDSQLARRDTSKVSKAVALWLNSLTGGDRVQGGAVDVSPATLDHWIGWAAGGAGRFAWDAANLPAEISGEELKVGRVPVARRFLGETNEPGANAREFYQLRRDAEQAYQKWRRYQKLGEQQKASAYRRDNAKLLGLRGRLENAWERVQDLETREQKAVSPEAKRRYRLLREKAIAELLRGLPAEMKDRVR